MNNNGLIELINSLFGGTVTTLFGALTGRLMWHAGEVRQGKRKFFGKEIVWEIPVAVGMAMVGEAVASYFGFGQPVSTGIVAVLAYLGPRGAEAFLLNWFSTKKK